MVHQQWKLHPTGSWHFRQLLTATGIVALSALHRRGPESAQELPTHRTVSFAVPNRLRQCFQPRPAQCTEHEPRIQPGTDYKCPAREEHTAGAEALLLKNKIRIMMQAGTPPGSFSFNFVFLAGPSEAQSKTE